MRKLMLLLIPFLLIGLLPMPAVQAQDVNQFGIIPAPTARTYQIFLQGQRMGNRPGVFSKIGDSITVAPQFMWQMGVGGLHLLDYGYLQPVVDYFSNTRARDTNSFAQRSLAADNGWSSYELLDVTASNPGLCRRRETPIQCEYRVNRPSIAFIMIGTNDVIRNVEPSNFQYNLNIIVEQTINAGVIPILSTIPDNLTSQWAADRVVTFNQIIINTALAYDIPLWNYWKALQPLPNKGLSGDMYHPSIPSNGEAAYMSADNIATSGYTVRNLNALQILEMMYYNVIVPNTQ